MKILRTVTFTTYIRQVVFLPHRLFCAAKEVLGLKDNEHFRKAYLLPLLELGWIEMMLPNKPNSSKQKYRITATDLAEREKYSE